MPLHNSHKVKKVLRVVGKTLLSLFLVLVILGSMCGCIGLVYVLKTYSHPDNVPDIGTIIQKQASIIYTKNPQTNEWEEFVRVQGATRVWTDLSDIPQSVQNAIVAIEDERFWTHYGVDWKRTVSAFVNLVFKYNQQSFGASTITQQLIKVLNEDYSNRTISPKMYEIFASLETEKKYTKEQILEAYLNMMPLGAVDGVGAGANYYFGKDISQLDLAESAYLVSITNNPSIYNPYLHPDATRERARAVLGKMYQLGFITASEYEQAYGEEVTFQSNFQREVVQDYYTDLVISDVIGDLMTQYGYTQTYAENLMYYGGLRIYSEEDPATQAKIEAIYADDGNFPAHLSRDDGKPLDRDYNPQSSIFIMDYTGKVVATAGGRGEKSGNRVLNRSTDSPRQLGSAVKPLASYGPAIDMNKITYSTMFDDTTFLTVNGKAWPPNYAGERFGPLPVVGALQRSVNTVAVQVLNTVGLQTSYDFMTKTLHFDLSPSDEAWAPLGVGGFTDGVTAREVAAGYQIFGNGGIYNKPYTYEKVTTVASGAEVTLLSNTPAPERAIQLTSATVMNYLLQQVCYGSAGTAASLAGTWTNIRVFGKTGTSGDSASTHDVWFAGGSPYYVGACWFGYDYNTPLAGSQTGYALKLWNKCMLAVHQGLAARDFPPLAGGVVQANFCTDTGMLAGPGCPHTAVGYYKPDNIPPVCDVHNDVSTTPSDPFDTTADTGTGASTAASTTGTTHTTGTTATATTHATTTTTTTT
ncbi:MAG: transglycosylase domain-containing protein, partial [Oscillospiraceae bacterium]|nr:transglycosylase domain-containing protein [Oscillospiraceae bacterium]